MNPHELRSFRQRQVRTIRERRGLLRKPSLDAQGVINHLANDPHRFEQLPTIRKLVDYFRQEKRIWVTREICIDALNLARARNGNMTLDEVTNTGLSSATLKQEPLT
jgi:hypothetical protein